ncbi:CrcB family protein [Planococcus sp. APC 4015]|nr:CrcB family protein [Planococcus sp. APC 4015]
MMSSDDDRTSPQPLYTQPRLVLLVFAGGVLGTAAREAVVLLMASDGLPWGVLTVNLVGAFLLGMLVRGLEARDETPRRRSVRLFAGAGMLGGFTTYSALATDALLLLETAPMLGVAFALVSVVAGVLCAAAGWAVAARLWPRHPESS